VTSFLLDVSKALQKLQSLKHVRCSHDKVIKRKLFYFIMATTLHTFVEGINFLSHTLQLHFGTKVVQRSAKDITL